MSIVSAPGLSGPLATMHLTGAINGAAFLLYLDHFLLPKLWPGAVVVMDNWSAHKLNAVRARIEAVGARLVYLPPDSPDLNPIELAWSKLESCLRKAAARNYRDPRCRHRLGSPNPHRPKRPRLVRSLWLQRLIQLKYALQRFSKRMKSGKFTR